MCARALVPCVLVCEDGLPLADGALINTWALSSQHHGQVSPGKPSQDQAPGTCARGQEEQTTHLLFNITQASQLIDRIRIKVGNYKNKKLHNMFTKQIWFPYLPQLSVHCIYIYIYEEFRCKSLYVPFEIFF